MSKHQATIGTVALLLALGGCATFDPSDNLDADVSSLHTPTMEEAIKAARAAKPRTAQSPATGAPSAH